MKMNSYGLFTHVDLDACAAGIVLSHHFDPIIAKQRGGYAKIEDGLNKLKKEGCENLIVADINLEPKQLFQALKDFKEVWYFDHHEGSLQIKEGLKGKSLPRFNPYIGNQSSAMLAYQFAVANTEGHQNSNPFLSDKPMQKLVMLTNIYDLWQIKNPHFNDAIDLNTIFWKYGYVDFFDRFKNGVDAYTDEEKRWMKEDRERKAEGLRNVHENRLELDSGSVVYVCSDKTLINDFTLAYPQYKVYYVMRRDAQRKSFAMSVRLLKDGPYSNGKLDMNYCINEARKTGFFSPDTVLSCGGHKEAAGVDFAPHATSDDVLMFIDAIEHEVAKYLANGYLEKNA